MRDSEIDSSGLDIALAEDSCQDKDFARLLAEFEEAGAEHRYVQTLGSFREAAHISRGSRTLQRKLLKAAIARARDFATRSWRVSAALLAEAEQLDCGQEIPSQIWHEIAAAERQESLATILSETADLAAIDDFYNARDRLLKGLQKYPDEPELQSRKAAIDLAIAKRLEAHQRNARLKLWAVERRDLERTDSPEVVKEVIRKLAITWAPYAADPDIAPILSEIQDQGLKAEQAAAALAQDRIQECLEISTAVLAQRPRFIIFLDLKEKAEAILETSAHIKSLVADGQVTQAERARRAAENLYPQTQSLWTLGSETEQKLRDAQTLFEQGEQCLKKREFQAAGDLFAQSVALFPRDAELADYIIEEIHDHARKVLSDDPQHASAILKLADRVRPGSEPPGDLAAELLRIEAERRHKADLETLSDFERQLDSAKSRQQLKSVRKYLQASALVTSSESGIAAQAASLLTRTGRAIESAPRNRTPILLLAAMALIGVVAVLWIGFVSHQPAAPIVAAPPAPPKISKPPEVTKVTEPPLVPRKTIEEPPPDASSVSKELPVPPPKPPQPHLEPRIANEAQAEGELNRQATAAAASVRKAQELEQLARLSLKPREPEPTVEAHIGPAPVKSVPDTSADTTAVLNLISALANAWSSKDINSILSLQHNLDRKTLKTQLSQAKMIAMKISPVSPPEITGTRAIVTCRRQADEVFSDGSVRKNPELVVTYLLAKRDGSWSVEGTK